MKKIILIMILAILTFSSCTKNEEETNELVKKDFYLDVKKIGEFDNIAFLNKTGKLDSTQNISLSSSANGRVKSILVKSGDNVSEGQVLATLDDNLSNYNLTLASSENNLAAAKNNLEVVKNGLDVSKNNLEKVKLNYESTKLKLDKTVSDIQRNLGNLQLSDNTTSTSIEIDKINNSINKLEADYKNLQSSNNETLSGFVRSLDKESIVLKNFVTDIVYFSDDILGVTDANKNKNNAYEIYLGAKDNSQKIESEKLLGDLIEYKKTVLDTFELGELSTTEQYKAKIDVINSSYSKIIKFLNSFDTTISNTVSSYGVLSDTQISGYKSTIGGYKTTYNAYNGGFISLSNSIYSFLETYKNGQASLLTQIENLGKDKDIYLKSLDLNKESSQATLDEAISNRDLTLRNLDLAVNDANSSIRDTEIRIIDAEIRVRDAENNYKKALNEVAKLSIKSPINGIIGDILIDKGQEISNGTPVISIISDEASEVELYFKDLELSTISSGINVYTTIANKTLTGSIYSISSVSDDSLNYKVLAVFNEKIQNLGGVIDVNIPVKSSLILIPIKNITLVGTNKGIVNIYDSGKIVKKEVLLGKMYKDNIEFISFVDGTKLDNNILVIMNDVSNFDENKFNLKVK